MKAPSFAYAKARSLEEALDLLERHGDAARVLAGGQSLIPSLNLRLSAPGLLVDIGGLDALRGITLEQGVVRIGALTTHAEIGRSAEIAKHVPLLAQAVPHVAHPAIRNRGTLGGSLALADPAAEYPAVALATDATLVVAGRGGERLVAAADFFRGLYETALAPGELVVGAEFPACKKDERFLFQEIARRHGDYAIVGLAARWSGDKRFAFLGAGPTPVLVRRTSESSDLKTALQHLESELDPPADLYNSSKTKRHLAKVLLERAWNTLSTSN